MTDVFPTILAGGSNPLDHVVDKKSALGPIIGFENLMLSTVSVVVAGIVAFLVLSVAARSIATGPASPRCRSSRSCTSRCAISA